LTQTVTELDKAGIPESVAMAWNLKKKEDFHGQEKNQD
jgi:hypothetical protein